MRQLCQRCAAIHRMTGASEEPPKEHDTRNPPTAQQQQQQQLTPGSQRSINFPASKL
jgi:hypothetical protein